MALLCSLLSAVFLLPLFSLASGQEDDGAACTCFITNTPSSNFFNNHRFYDFRNFTGASTPPEVTWNVSAVTSSSPALNSFNNSGWESDWSVQNWSSSDQEDGSGDATVLMINSPGNVYIEKSTDSSTEYSSYLTLRTARLPGFQSVGEIDSVEKNFHYLSARFHARVMGSPGACAGIFTYRSPKHNKPLTVQEADIEILTRDPRDRVQYTNQPSQNSRGNDQPQATLNTTNPGQRDWTSWNTYRVDWTPKLTAWYVNDHSVANISFQTPVDPAGLILNMWGNGGSWTGNMSLYDEAYLHVQWIEVVYNTSAPDTGAVYKRDGQNAGGLLEKRKGHKGCEVVCSIDQVNFTGTPALLYNNTASLGLKDAEGGWLSWLPKMVIGSAALALL